MISETRNPAHRRPGKRGLLRFVATVLLIPALSSCATWQAPPDSDDSDLRQRAVSAVVKDVRLSAAVLGADDSRRLFGEDINATDVQPVWIEVDNPTPHPLWLLRSGTDPDYFSPLEVAWSFHAPLGGQSNDALDKHFDSLDFFNPIPPGSTRHGIIFTNPHHQTRLLNVDLLGPHQIFPYTLFLPVPDEEPSRAVARIRASATESGTVDHRDAASLRSALKKLPCCATGPDGVAAGDPVNVVLVGSFEDVAAAFVRRGFRNAPRAFDDNQRLFGRPPDLVARKSVKAGAPANWLRLWLTPVRFQGQSVFAGQAGRPAGGRFAEIRDDDATLHPDVDEARNLLIQDLFYSGGLTRFGYETSLDTTAAARGADPPGSPGYTTDGLKAVLFFATRPMSIGDVRYLDWAPYLKHLESEAAAESHNE
jgi:hypothetical protein